MKTLHVYKRLFEYVMRYRLRLCLLIGISLLGVLFEVLKPLPVKIILDNVLSNQPFPGVIQHLLGHSFNLEDKVQLLFISIVTLVVIIAGSAALSLIAFNYTVNLSQGLVYDLSIDFFNKLQRLSLRFHAKNKIGDLLQRMNGDVFVVYFVVAQILVPSITSIVCLFGMFYVMVKINLVLALIAFTVVPLLGISLSFFARPMNDTTMDQYTRHGQLSAFVQQSLTSMKIIQAFGREPFMFRKMKEHTRSFSNAFKVANKVSMFYNQLSLLFTGLISAVVIGVGGYKVLHGSLSIGDLFVFLGYITALNGPVTALSNAIGTGVTIGARGKRIFEIIDSDEVVTEKNNATSITNITGAIEFRNVTFGYGQQGESAAVLEQVSFSTSPGQIVAIVGPTGAGKTSLISLITRFYDPWHGQVLIDGQDIKDVKLHSLREQISMVLQEPFLFPMSIGENISFGNPDASFDEIINAAKASQSHEFIMNLPEQYDTLLTENGASLSGGQKQRLSIARAFLKNAPIVILDEPTSAVDALTESKIFKALAEFSKGKTVFLISHRLSTLTHADQIITIKDGYVVEKGTHQSLLAKKNVYADLYKHQHIA